MDHNHRPKPEYSIVVPISQCLTRRVKTERYFGKHTPTAGQEPKIHKPERKPHQGNKQPTVKSTSTGYSAFMERIPIPKTLKSLQNCW